MNDLTLEKYEYSYSLMTVMGSDGDIEHSTIIETDNPFNYYFREDSYKDTVDLVEMHTGKIVITWPLYSEKFNKGAFKHRFYSINKSENFGI